MENCVVVPKKLKVVLPCDPAIPLLNTYPKELKAWTEQIFVNQYSKQHLFTLAKGGSNPSVY
jgi:hypothetical protein